MDAIALSWPSRFLGTDQTVVRYEAITNPLSDSTRHRAAFQVRAPRRDSAASIRARRLCDAVRHRLFPGRAGADGRDGVHGVGDHRLGDPDLHRGRVHPCDLHLVRRLGDVRATPRDRELHSLRHGRTRVCLAVECLRGLTNAGGRAREKKRPPCLADAFSRGSPPRHAWRLSGLMLCRGCWRTAIISTTFLNS